MDRWRATPTEPYESESRRAGLFQDAASPAARWSGFRRSRPHGRAGRCDCEPGVCAQVFERRESGGPTFMDRGDAGIAGHALRDRRPGRRHEV